MTWPKCNFFRTSREKILDFIALMETGRPTFSTPFLSFLCGGLDFSWYCLPPKGRSGGILLGVNNSSIEVLNTDVGDFVVKFHVRSRSDGFSWALVAVYGAAQPELKPDFLSELVRICGSESLPMLVGGDFNIIRRQDEKTIITLMQDGLLCSMRLLKT